MLRTPVQKFNETVSRSCGPNLEHHAIRSTLNVSWLHVDWSICKLHRLGTLTLIESFRLSWGVSEWQTDFEQEPKTEAFKSCGSPPLTSNLPAQGERSLETALMV